MKDENSAAEVGAALTQFHRLTENRAILLIHHLRKSDGAEGTGSRGSGALAGFADILIELRRQKASYDSGQRRRVLTGFGRYEAIPPEWVVELAEETNRFEHRPEGGGSSPTATRLHEAILALLKEAGETGLTRKQLWDKLPEAVKRNEPRSPRQSGAGSVPFPTGDQTNGSKPVGSDTHRFLHISHEISHETGQAAKVRVTRSGNVAA